MIDKVAGGISIVVLAVGLSAAPAMLGQAVSQVRPADVTITGTVTCSKYVYSSPSRKGFTAAEAIRMCISQGYSWVIVSGRDVYPLEGDYGKLAKLAGEKVTITGHVDTERSINRNFVYHDVIDTTAVAPSSK
jgi:hypothetical protein